MIKNLTFENSPWELIWNNVKNGFGPKYYPVGSKKRGSLARIGPEAEYFYNKNIDCTFIVLDHNRDGENTMTVWIVPDRSLSRKYGFYKRYVYPTNPGEFDCDVRRYIESTFLNSLEKVQNGTTNSSFISNTDSPYYFNYDYPYNCPKLEYLKDITKRTWDTGQSTNDWTSKIFIPSMDELGLHTVEFVPDSYEGLKTKNFVHIIESNGNYSLDSYNYNGAYEYFLKQENRAVGYKYWTRQSMRNISNYNSTDNDYMCIVDENGLPNISNKNGTLGVCPYIVIG